MRDLNINVGLLPRLGLVGLPDHLALGSILVQRNPAFELGIVGSHCIRN